MSGKVYFSADDGVRGHELWVTDGTRGGTCPVKDIVPDTDPSTPPLLRGSNPFLLTDLGDGRVAFTAADPGATRLWVSDGSEAGTGAVREITTSTAGLIQLRPGRILFSDIDVAGGRGAEPWVTDGTVEGTAVLADINTVPHPNGGTQSSDPGQFAVLDYGRAVFTASETRDRFSSDGSWGNALWVTDGTADGTRLLQPTQTRDQSDLFEVGDGRALFEVRDDALGGRVLWVTDGTPAGTRPLAASDGRTTFLDAFDFSRLPDGALGFSATVGGSLVTVRTDGTAAGTVELPRPTPDPAPDPGWPEGPEDWVFKGQQAYLAALPDGTHLIAGQFIVGNAGASTHRNDHVLAVTDGTTEGTRPVGDFGNLGLSDAAVAGGASERQSDHLEVYTAFTHLGLGGPFALPDGRIVFEGNAWGEERALFAVRDADTVTRYLDARALSDLFTFANGNHLFRAEDATGTETTYLASASGAVAITEADLQPALELARGVWLFIVDRGVADVNGDGTVEAIRDLWVSDGTAARTHLVRSDTHFDF